MSFYQTIYNRLRQHGMTEAGALGCLGNWECESNCEPYRLQGDFSSYRSASKAYAKRVNDGSMSREEFSKPVGFGIAQWTYHTRKAEMYDERKKLGCLVDDPVFQVDFAVKELKRDFIPDWRLLCSTSDVYEATKAVCQRFENPAIHNVDARFQAANKIRHEIDLKSWKQVQEIELTEPTDPVTSENDQNLPSGWEKIPATEYWPPRTLCKGMTGSDVEVLQAVLKARGWISTNPDGQFGSYLEENVKNFQQVAFPNESKEWDGIVGPKTWSKLLDMK